MTYSATAFRLLISAPSDVRTDDIAAVVGTVGRWNAIYGQQFGAVVVPTNWKQHSTASFGVRPQEALNEQLVDEADVVIALFWHRLGSPTGEAESGTVEEIEKAHESGAYVGVLRCRRDIPQEDLDTEQMENLKRFYDRIQDHALIGDYANESALREHVDAILNRAVSTSQARAATAVQVLSKPADVWPRVETQPMVRGGSLAQQHQLVLTNTGPEPARDVRFRFQMDENAPGSLPLLVSVPANIDVLPPHGGEVRYTLAVTMGTAAQVNCFVHWTDSVGEHENQATLRFF